MNSARPFSTNFTNPVDFTCHGEDSTECRIGVTNIADCALYDITGNEVCVCACGGKDIV